MRQKPDRIDLGQDLRDGPRSVRVFSDSLLCTTTERKYNKGSSNLEIKFVLAEV